MGLMETLLGKVTGEVHFYIFLDKSKVAEVKMEGSEIIIDIQNPLVAMKMGLDEYIKNRDKLDASQTIDRLKKLGYSLKIRYKMLEFEV